jgi:hypothetical protein
MTESRQRKEDAVNGSVIVRCLFIRSISYPDALAPQFAADLRKIWQGYLDTGLPDDSRTVQGLIERRIA